MIAAFYRRIEALTGVVRIRQGMRASARLSAQIICRATNSRSRGSGDLGLATDLLPFTFAGNRGRRRLPLGVPQGRCGATHQPDHALARPFLDRDYRDR